MRPETQTAIPLASWPRVVGFVFPFGLAIALVPLAAASVASRMVLLVPVIGIVRALRKEMRRAEARWALFLALMVLGGAVSVLVAGLRSHEALQDRDMALDIGRQTYISVMAVTWAIALRSADTRAAASAGLGWFALLAAAIILWAYVGYAGFTFVGFSELAKFKFFADQSYGIALNPLSFACAFSAILAWPSWAQSRAKAAVLLLCTGAAVVLSGSRMTQLSVLSGMALVYVYRAGRRRAKVWGPFGMLLLLAALSVASMVEDLPRAELDTEATSKLTTGRLELWLAALDQIAERPLVGSGPGSWRYTAEAHLPAFSGSGAIATSGSYHNAYLSLLAEKGLVTAVPAILMLAALVGWAIRVDLARSSFVNAWDRTAAGITLLAQVVVLVRGFGEQPGYFGDANGVVDFLVFLAGAWTVALAGIIAKQPIKAGVVLSESLGPPTSLRRRHC